MLLIFSIVFRSTTAPDKTFQSFVPLLTLHAEKLIQAQLLNLVQIAERSTQETCHVIS